MQGIVRGLAVSTLALLAALPVSTFAQELRVPQSASEMQMSFAPLVKQTHG
ncbi:MAG: serine protease, partial [Rhizobium sp.]|nr:serine protease [Rhizobium sp.]